VFDKLKKEELLSLGLHFGLEVKSRMKKQEIRTLVAKKLLAENIFTTYDFSKLEPSGMSELEFQLAMENLKFESQEQNRQEREKEREREREEREKEREREPEKREKEREEREREREEKEREREFEREKMKVENERAERERIEREIDNLN
jgi:hypothetical protein